MLYFNRTRLSKFESVSFDLLGEKVRPPVENNLSTGALLGRAELYLIKSFFKTGYSLSTSKCFVGTEFRKASTGCAFFSGSWRNCFFFFFVAGLHSVSVWAGPCWAENVSWSNLLALTCSSVTSSGLAKLQAQTSLNLY